MKRLAGPIIAVLLVATSAAAAAAGRSAAEPYVYAHRVVSTPVVPRRRRSTAA